MYGEDACPQGYYFNASQSSPDGPTLNSGPSCVPCSSCPPGQGVLTRCLSADTVCQSCPQGHYSTAYNNRQCTACTNCSQLNRIEMSECTPSRDSVCGKCSSGYFLSLNYDGGTECLQCSYCPPNEDVMRWYECSDLPDSQQCAPGNVCYVCLLVCPR